MKKVTQKAIYNKKTTIKLGVFFLHLVMFSFLCNITGLAANEFVAEQGNNYKITGVVLNQKGETMIGVNVIEEGFPNLGTITDFNGKFSLNVSSEKVNLLFSYIGYVSQKVAVGGKKELRVIMVENAEVLDEVIVVGYGVQKKASITGSITSVANDQLIKSPVSNVSNALSGRLSGVTLVQRSGEPGRDQSEIKIRGISTLNSSQSTPLIIIDGVERTSLDGIDMNEIESINVLKDASATAVYGIRGANGVLILTTKTGDESKPVVNMSINSGLQTPTQLPDFLNSYEFALLKNEGMRNDGLVPFYSQETLDKFKYGTDPVFYPTEALYKQFFKQFSYKQQYNVNITGGTKAVRYFVSLGFLNQEGQYNTESIKKLNIGYDPNPLYKRYNVRSNFDFNFSKNFTGSIKIGGQFSDSNYPNRTTESLFSVILNSPPMIGYGIHDGKLVTGYLNDPLSFLAGRGLSTASVLLSNGYSNRLENTININVGAKYKLDDIIKGLSIRSMFAYDHFYGRSEVRNRAIDTYYAVKDGGDNLVLIPRDFEGGFDTFSEGHSVYRIEYFEAALEYLNGFGNHRVSGLLLYNQRKRTIPGLDYSVPESLQGIVGRATYAYADKYFTEFNLGYNGSENFPEEFRFGLFPALSVGWVLSEEPFFPKNNIIEWVKFRASYGVVGNDKIGGSRFLYLPTSYAYGGVVYQFGNEGVDRENYKSAMEGQIGNPYVTWEKAIKQNAGLDIRLFKSKLILTADYFFENRNNILINRSTVPAIVGVTELPAVNMGRVENSGFEFETHWKDKKGKLTYTVDANISFAKNKILFQDEPAKAYPWMMSTGFSVGQLKGYRTEGLYNQQDEVDNRPYYSFYSNMVQRGDIKYVDIDGDGKVDQNDVVPIGYNEYPQITFGCNLGLKWNGFDAAVLFQGATQTSIQQRVMTAWAFNLGANNTLSEHLNRWNEERYSSDQLITMPRLSSDGKNSPNAETSDFWLEDATYLRLKNIELGYSITSKTLSQMGLNTLRVYVNGNNILTFTNLKNADPENPTKNVGAVYPQMKVFNVGANIRF